MYEKPKKILVAGASDMVTAYQLSDNMIEIGRLDQKIMIDFKTSSVMVTSPKHLNGKPVYTTITATDGKIDEADLEYKEEKPPKAPDGKKQKVDENGEPVVDDDGNPVYEDAE
jgi:hypothetical protein